MPYLVDGNNVMGQRVGWHRDRAGARRRLVDELAMFARASGERTDVVFDGPPDDALLAGAHGGEVGVYFAGPGSDADTRIEQIVVRALDRQTLTVVTSDRRLADVVGRAGVRVERSGALRRRLDDLVKQDAAAEAPRYDRVDG